MSNGAGLAVITGAASPGIGEAITRRLHRDGFEIWGTYEQTDETAATRLGRELGVSLLPVDHASRQDMARATEALGVRPISAMIFAQSYFALEAGGTVDFTEWDRVLAVNLTAPAHLYQLVGERLAPGSSYVIISSSEALRGSYAAAGYAAAKAGVHSLVKSLANRGGSTDVRTNAVAPGWISDVMPGEDPFPAASDLTPLHRLGSSDEVASTVAFLLSKESSFINGATVVVDGGYSASDPVAREEFLASPADD